MRSSPGRVYPPRERCEGERYRVMTAVTGPRAHCASVHTVQRHNGPLYLWPLRGVAMWT